MLSLLLNLRLKYKFWLLNGVSFSIVCALVLASIWINYHHILDAKHTDNESILSSIQASNINLDNDIQIELIKASPYLILSNKEGYTFGSKVKDLIDINIIEAFINHNDLNRTIDGGIFSLEPTLVFESTSFN